MAQIIMTLAIIAAAMVLFAWNPVDAQLRLKSVTVGRLSEGGRCAEGADCPYCYQLPRNGHPA